MKITVRELFIKPFVLIGITLIISGLFFAMMASIGLFNLPFNGESESMGPATDSHSWGCDEGDILQGSFDGNGLPVTFHIDYYDRRGVEHENVLIIENVTEGNFNYEVEENGIYNLIVEGDLHEPYIIRTEYVKIPEITRGIMWYGFYQSIAGILFIGFGFLRYVMLERHEYAPGIKKM